MKVQKEPKTVVVNVKELLDIVVWGERIYKQLTYAVISAIDSIASGAVNNPRVNADWALKNISNLAEQLEMSDETHNSIRDLLCQAKRKAQRQAKPTPAIKAAAA